MQELTPKVNGLLDALRERARKQREFNYFSGWKPLTREALPSLHELAQLHRSYGPVTRKKLLDMMLIVPQSRGVVEVADDVIGAIFDVESGSYLITFSTKKRTVRGFFVGGVKPPHCSKVTTEFVTAFEIYAMPAKAHAAELLKE